MRTLPDPGFAGDEGTADLAVTAALQEHGAAPDDPGLRHRALAALQLARLLVPVVASSSGHVGEDHDKEADMSAVLMQSRSGRTALLAFTGLPTLTAWNPEARPVPLTAGDAAKGAIQNGAEALLVDVAGPVLFAVEGGDLTSLAAGHRLVELARGRWGWVAPA